MTTKKLLIAFSLLLWGAVTFAQQSVVSGIVNSDDGSPLPGASVMVKGTTNGTVTDIDGKYSLSVSGIDAPILVFSFIGYLNEEKVVGDQTEINVTLVPDIKSLDEIIVVGYGVTKKSLVTGAISKVNSEQLTQTKNLRVEQALQGKVSGVSISQNSGSPGSGMTVRIRGVGSNSNSSPLYVVDGMKVGGIEDINPNDIASIEILKDAASAAIYGSEAANGVILISTKGGNYNSKGIATYDGYVGFNEASNLPTVLNSEQYVKFFKEGYAHEKMWDKWRTGVVLDETDPAVQSYVDKNMPYNEDTVGMGTDWLNEISSPAQVQSHNLSFSGGSESSTYFLSMGYYDEDGIIGTSKSNFKRYTLNINGTHKVNNWLEVNAKLNFVNHKRSNIDENNEFGGIVSMAEAIDPLTPVYYDDASQLPSSLTEEQKALVPKDGDKYFGLSQLVTNEIVNPMAWMHITHLQNNLTKVLGKAGAKVSFTDWLSYNNNVSFENWNNQREDWKPAYYFHGLRNDPKSYIQRDFSGGMKFFFDQYLNFNKSFGDHTVSGLVGMSYEHYQELSMGARARQILYENQNFAYLSQAQDTVLIRPWDGSNEVVMISYFGRLSYNYKEKFLFTGNFRSDGSNKFGKNNRFGYFPSVSAGYVISKENFWPSNPVNFLKVRGSWGRNGSTSSLGNWDWTSTISFEGNRAMFGETPIAGARPSKSSNPDLRWEQSQQFDIGFDAGLFQNKLFLTADFFNKTTIDLLIQGTPPIYTGNTPPTINAGNVNNKGVELDLTYNNHVGDFNYSVSFNTTYLKNEVLELTKDVKRITGTSVGVGQGNINMFEEGQPAWYYYGFKTDGVFNDTTEIANYTNEDGVQYQRSAIPGDVKFLDVNGLDSLGQLSGQPDGVIDDNDRVYLGQPYAKMQYGLNVTLEYKGFDFAMLWQAYTGNSVFNGTYRSDLGKNNKPIKYWDERWDPAHPEVDNVWFRATVTDKNRNYRPSDLFVENGSYLKLRQLMLGYTLPAKFTNKIKVSKFRLYVSADNLLTITKYTGADPEVGQTDGWAANVGVDRGFYPSSRSYKLGLVVQF